MIFKIVEWCLEYIAEDLKQEQSIRLLSVRAILHIWVKVELYLTYFSLR